MANYLRQGSEDVFIEDSAEIEYAKLNNLRKSITGFMLGDFDERGVYTVDEEIVKELIGLKKYIVDIIDNMVVCQSALRLNKPITFLVSFDEDCASLSLLEKVNHQGNFKENAGSFCDINEYLLDKIETSGIIDRTYVYKRWHISEAEEPALSIHDLDEESLAELFGVAKRYKYLLYCNTILLEKEQELEAEQISYSEQIGTLLASYPELKKKVDEQVKQTLEEKQNLICLDKPFVVGEINEVIEQAIEDNLDVLNEKEQEKFKEEKHIVQNNHNLRMAEILPMRVEKPLNAENVVGRVVVDTLLATSVVVANAVVNRNNQQVEGEEKAGQLGVAMRVEDLSIKQLQVIKDEQRQVVEERTKKAYVDLRLDGGAKEEKGEQKNKKLENLKRLANIIGATAVINNASKKTKEEVANRTKEEVKQETGNKSLVGKAATKTATAKAGETKSASDTKSAGNNKKAQANKSADKKPAAKSEKDKTAAADTSKKKTETKSGANRVASSINKTEEKSTKPEEQQQPQTTDKSSVQNKQEKKTELQLKKEALAQEIAKLNGGDLGINSAATTASDNLRLGSSTVARRELGLGTSTTVSGELRLGASTAAKGVHIRKGKGNEPSIQTATTVVEKEDIGGITPSL